MKWLVSLLVLLNSVRLQDAGALEGALRKFVQVNSAALNTVKESWGGDHVTEEQCAEECLRRPDCASFEMQDTNCFLSDKDSTGRATVRSNPNRNFFQRIRPNQEVIILKKVTIPAEDHLGLVKRVSVSECTKKCRENPHCTSFEFKETARKCDLSNVTHHTHDLHPSKWGWDIYIFNPDYKPIDCGKPPEIIHATVEFEHTDYLANATYKCETGETYTVVCEENNKWSHLVDVCKKPLDCGRPPLLGYAGVDYKETSLKSTATYSCLMGEKYTVVCGANGKWTMPKGRCRNPRSCEEFKKCGRHIPDGEYWIYPKILNGERVKVFCQGMATHHPKEYITLKKENFALASPLKSIGIFCLSRTALGRGRPGKSIYHKVRLLPERMVLQNTDYKYVNLVDGFGSFKHDFATAEDCLFRNDDRCNSQGAFQVDLIGTGLAIDKSVKWESYGYYSRVQSLNRSHNDQKIRGVCGGTCGGCRPNGPLKVNIFSDDQPNTISAEFCQEM
uniref:GON-SepT-2 n=2 Tax=Sepioteuthis australis TaxID=61682 RepID=R4G7D8_9MOLL